jgi:hypothetical protein
MSLSQLAEFGSFISGVAILTSLIFLYFQLRQINHQVRQAEKNEKSAIRQGRANRTVRIILAGTEPSLADAFTKGTFGDEDILRAVSVNSEDTYYQHTEGLLDETGFAGFVAGMKGSFRYPGFRAQWKSARRNYGIEFVEFMDKLLAETPLIPAIDVLARWRADIAADLPIIAMSFGRDIVTDLPIYPAGSPGPSEADALLARDGRRWRSVHGDDDRNPS